MTSPDTPTDGHTLAAISNAVVHVLHAQNGRGPGAAASCDPSTAATH